MYTKILVPVDGSPTSERGLAEAIRLGALTGAQLKLLHVVDMASVALAPELTTAVDETAFAPLKARGEQILADAKSSVAKGGLNADTLLVEALTGRVCDAVIAEAQAWGAELIVVGTHGRRGVRRLVLGSDAEQVARLAPVPVLLVRGAEPAARSD